MTDTDYARREEVRHRRKIILPVVIPWEYGSNKYASQKGSAGFGTNRNATLKIFSTTPLAKPDESVLPKFAASSGDLASQAGGAPMGKFRDHVIHVKDQHKDELVEIGKLLPDKNKKSERLLRKWDQPNRDAKNTDVFGMKRDVITTPTGGRRFTHEEQVKSRAAIPRFQDPRNTIAALAAKPGESVVSGLTRHRQATTEIEGLDRTEQDQLDTNRYMGWLGGQLTLQSQSRTGGFQKPRDVVSTSYYDKMMGERERDARTIREAREREKTKSKDNLAEDKEEDE